MVVGGNKMEGNTSRALAAEQRRLDLQALVKDFNTMMPHTHLDSIGKFFVNDKFGFIDVQ
jgi:hypothetical protein